MTTTVGAELDLDFEDEDSLNAGWILREDAALKARLSGIRVPVANEARQDDPDSGDDDAEPQTINSKLRLVPVFFRLPENEVRRRTYPYITIDMLTVVRDTEREHRGYSDYGLTENAYTPMGMPTAGGRAELPVPYQIQYQITQWSRWNRHDRIIMTKLLTTRLEPRFGYLEMVATDEAPDDLSVRRMDLLSGPTNGDMRDEQGKRVFRKMYTVGVSSELFHSDIEKLAAVSHVVIDVVDTESVN